MVKGLDLFKKHFINQTEHFMLIGGSACELTLKDNGGFRATKDIDLLVLLETLDNDFAACFHDFLQQGGYKCYVSKDGKRHFYRFIAPKESPYPSQIELLSRSLLPEHTSSSFTPLAVDEYVKYMSAIILSDTYYHYALLHRTMKWDLPCLDTEGLLVFKSVACLNLTKQKTEAPQSVRSDDIHKHRNDVFRLLTTVSPTSSATVPDEIAQDLLHFIEMYPLDSSEWHDMTQSLNLQDSAKNALHLRYRSFFQLS